MVVDVINYLIGSSLCLTLFLGVYRFLISDLTDFSWMRFYLVVSLTLSIALPLINIPIQVADNSFSNEPLSIVRQISSKPLETLGHYSQINIDSGSSKLKPGMLILYLLMVAYLIGVIYRTAFFLRNLYLIFGFIKSNPKTKEGNCWMVDVKNEGPAFSFFNYIFINKNQNELSTYELQLVKDHELTHVKHRHTLDLLFVEVAGIVFWFNPLMRYLKRSIREVHEYSVDEKVAGHGENKKAYAQLLLTLAYSTTASDIVASFTGEHIKRRILMMAKPRTSSKHKLIFFVLIPLTAFLLVSFSCLKTSGFNKMQIEGESSGLSREGIDRSDRSPWPIAMELKDYCGVYFPSKKNSNVLKPMEIMLKDNKLFRSIDAGSGSVNGTAELYFETDSLFSCADNSTRKILFFLDSKKEVTGCALVKLETREQTNYLVLVSEYWKGEPGK